MGRRIVVLTEAGQRIETETIDSQTKVVSLEFITSNTNNQRMISWRYAVQDGCMHVARQAERAFLPRGKQRGDGSILFCIWLC